MNPEKSYDYANLGRETLSKLMLAIGRFYQVLPGNMKLKWWDIKCRLRYVIQIYFITSQHFVTHISTREYQSECDSVPFQ